MLGAPRMNRRHKDRGGGGPLLERPDRIGENVIVTQTRVLVPLGCATIGTPPLPLEHPPKTDGASRTRPESDRVVRIARHECVAAFAAAPRDRKFHYRSAAES